ncbi:MAG: hypothetical protein PVH84_11080, partial [Candidatus Aminicenantes bacterium]
EVAAELGWVGARRKGCSWSRLPQILCNEADAAGSARLQGKKCRLLINSTTINGNVNVIYCWNFGNDWYIFY